TTLAGTTYVSDVALAITFPSCFHTYVKGACPPATTFKLNAAPAEANTADGCVLMTGAKRTVNVAAWLVAEPRPLLTFTVYLPESAPVTEFKVRVAEFEFRTGAPS